MTTPTNAGHGHDLIEVEVKFLLDDFAAIRRRLIDVGALLVAPRVFEHNIRFDTADESLLARQELLRLRQDTRTRLTFKGVLADAEQGEAKVREEIEIEVGDFNRMSVILQRLGFRPVQTYEKYRETYQWQAVEIVLDEMPFGRFVELEGAEVDLKTVAAALGLDWSRRLLTNYLELMMLCRREFDLSFSDLTFDNFRDRAIDMSRLLPLCVVGHGEAE
ncbi:MAG: class IV adenylate cyclase [Anaerolineae bacterium]|uniref:class IV adenylate cyclase n=1 Tax=Promineifilum sp. TaxID=2664178 RepID=UPI001D3C705D|nr:class IV adenylate cyclase [Anaerolineales bacterium]MCB8936486.1 class IV adenylate cyclase [Promineifilum sp.]MCO5180237.1 class IV adenylate cyclase [Promineifilum sp.]MCW5846077.1 class IV adenylate cyclase [Anaerolineae bacterium]